MGKGAIVLKAIKGELDHGGVALKAGSAVEWF